MPDWLMKIFISIISVKTAAIALLTCISLITLWNKGTLFIKNNGVPEGYAPYLLFIILFSTSHIIVDWSIKLWGFIKVFLSEYKLSKDKKVMLETFRGAIKKVMSHLPYPQMKILKRLSQGERAYNPKENGIRDLENPNYIKRLHKVSHDSYIFEITPLVKSELSSYLKSERIKKLKELAENISEEEKTFLSLFFMDAVSEGTPESGRMMNHKVYASGNSMAYNDLLEHFTSSPIERFSLHPETVEILENTVFNKSCVRKEICLDANYIGASGASGGGALGRFTK